MGIISQAKRTWVQAVSVILLVFSVAIMATVDPSVAKGTFGSDKQYTVVGILGGINGLTLMIVAPLLGALSDIFGRGIPLLVSFAVMTVPPTVYLATGSFEAFYFSRAPCMIYGASFALIAASVVDYYRADAARPRSHQRSNNNQEEQQQRDICSIKDHVDNDAFDGGSMTSKKMAAAPSSNNDGEEDKSAVVVQPDAALQRTLSAAASAAASTNEKSNHRDDDDDDDDDRNSTLEKKRTEAFSIMIVAFVIGFVGGTLLGTIIYDRTPADADDGNDQNNNNRSNSSTGSRNPLSSSLCDHNNMSTTTTTTTTTSSPRMTTENDHPVFKKHAAHLVILSQLISTIVTVVWMVGVLIFRPDVFRSAHQKKEAEAAERIEEEEEEEEAETAVDASADRKKKNSNDDDNDNDEDGSGDPERRPILHNKKERRNNYSNRGGGEQRQKQQDSKRSLASAASISSSSSSSPRMIAEAPREKTVSSKIWVVFSNRGVIFSILIIFFDFIAEQALQSLMLLYLKNVLDFSPEQTTVLILFMSVATLVGNLWIIRWLRNLIGLEKLLKLALLCNFLSVVFFSFLNQAWMAYCTILLAAVGTLVFPCVTSLASLYTTDESAGTAQGVTAIARFVAESTSPSLFGIFLQRMEHKPWPLPGVPFLGCALSVFVAFVFSCYLPEIPGTTTANKQPGAATAAATDVTEVTEAPASEEVS